MRALLVGILVIASAAHAEDAPRQVTLAEVLAATSKAPAAKIAQHELAAAAALVEVADAWPNPSVRLETNRLTARLVAGATVPLPVLGTVGAARHAAAAHAGAVHAEAVVFDRALRRRAIDAWIALARADGALTTTTLAVTQAAELERIAVGRIDAGVGAEVDVSTARAARARAVLAAATAKRAHEAAAAELAGILGWDPDRALVTTGELPGQGTITLEVLRARLPDHPLRTVGQRHVTAADAELEQVKAQGRPGLAVEAQISAADPTTSGIDALVAVSVELPMFAHTRDRARAARASASAERARLVVTETELGAGLLAAYHRWQGASETVAALDGTIVPAQVRAAELSAQAYREGQRDLASALQADRDLAAVRAEQLAARADLAAAWVELQDASGGDPGGIGAR